MDNLEQAISTAIEAHKNQLDKAGNPYIDHCIRIMNKMDTEEEKIVAVLHDILEDNEELGRNLFSSDFSDEIINALAYLTKQKHQKYLDYIKAIKNNELATKVKIADLLDNINLSRLNTISIKDINRTRKYLDALEYLIT